MMGGWCWLSRRERSQRSRGFWPWAIPCALTVALVYYPGGLEVARSAAGPRTYLAAADDLTPNLRACEYFAHLGQRGLAIARPRMRGTEDPPPPLDHVLEYTLGFEQVVACVEISLLVSADWCWFKRRWSRVHSGWATRAAARRWLIFSVSS